MDENLNEMNQEFQYTSLKLRMFFMLMIVKKNHLALASSHIFTKEKEHDSSDDNIDSKTVKFSTFISISVPRLNLTDKKIKKKIQRNYEKVSRDTKGTLNT